MFGHVEKFNFKIGQPPEELAFPEYFQKAVTHAFDKVNDKDAEKNMYLYKLLNYGEFQGSQYLRQEISDYLTKDLMYTVDKKNIFITGGVSHGIDLLNGLLIKEGDNVLVEAPSYFLAFKIIKDRGANLIPVERNENGELDLENIEKVIVEKKIKAFYLVPTCHNPIGVNLPLEQRNAIWNLSLKHKFYLYCDDIYEPFHFVNDVKRIAPTFVCSNEIVAQKDNHRKEILEYSFEKNPYVISFNSFNKMLNPGMRIGWVLCDVSLIDQIKKIGFINSNGGVSSTMNHIVTSFMQLGYLDKMMDSTRKNFANRVQEIEKVLGGCEHITYEVPKYGYFYWLKLSDKVNIEKLKEAFKKEDIHVLFGDLAVPGDSHKEERFQYLKRRIRICFVRYPLDRVLEGCKLLRKCVEENANNYGKF